MRKVGGHVSIAGGLSNAIGRTLDIGGNCMQIFVGSPRLWARAPFPDGQVSFFLKGSEENHLNPIFIHALYLVNLASDNKELVEKSTNSLIADLNNGGLIKSAGVIVHVGSHQGRGFNTVRDQISKEIVKILEATSDTPLILENDAGQNGKIGSIPELEEILNTVNSPRIKICLDTAHLFESGVDIRSQEVVSEFSDDLVRRGLLEKLACIHLNDSETDLDSHRDNHANIGEGMIGSLGLSNMINHSSFSHLPLILEVPGADKQGPDKINLQKTLDLIK